MKIAYLLDSSAGINEQPENHIYVIPLEIIEHKKNHEMIIHKDDCNFSLEKLNEGIINSSTFKTGQAAIGIVQDRINDLLKIYDLVISIPIDKQLSGAYNTWKILENEFESNKFYVVDVQCVQLGITSIIKEIQKWLEKNKFNANTLTKFIEQIRCKTGGVIIVNDVSQLITGGRLKGWKALLIKTFKFKILIQLLGSNGLLQYFAKTRDDNEAMQTSLKFLDEQIQWTTKGIKEVIVTTTILDKKENERIVNCYKKLLPNNIEIKLEHLPSVIAVHTGINSYAIMITTN